MVQVSNAALEILERIERNQRMTDHTLEELKALLDAQGAKLTTVKGHVEAIMTRLAAIPAQGLSLQQQTLVNEMVNSAYQANATIDATDAKISPAPAPAAETPPPAAPTPPAETTAPAAVPPAPTPPPETPAPVAPPESAPAAPTEPPPHAPAPDGTAQEPSAPAAGAQQPST